MAQNNNLSDYLKGIADAIRTKKSTSGVINAQNFASEIESIEVSGETSSDYPIIGDGKTYLHIRIAAKGRMNIPLVIKLADETHVIINWGDGSNEEAIVGSGNKERSHTYADIGDYTISLDVVYGTIELGSGVSGKSVLGKTDNKSRVYTNMLKAVEIGDNIESIPHSAFYYCTSLSSITIPNSVTSIGDYAFYYCTSLSSITIPNSVTSIGDFTFNGCTSLSSITIPNSVTSIGKYTFYNCSALSRVVLEEGVEEIGNNAFYSVYSLSSMVMPKSVTSIGGNTFQNCYAIAFFDFTKSTVIPTLGSSSFSNTPTDCRIVVPDALYDEWIIATNWVSIASKIVKASEFNA